MVLQSIRDRLTGIIAIFIFGILIIPFAFVGVSSYFTSDAVNAVAMVNGEEITVNDFNQSFQNYRRNMQAQLGNQFDAEQFDQPIIKRQHLDQLIDEQLLIQVSKEAGLAVEDQRLAQAIRDIPAFEVDGEFNLDVYQARLAAQGMTPSMFEDEMRASLILRQFPGAVVSSAIATRWEVEQFVSLADQTRTFEAIVVPSVIETDPEQQESFSDEEIQSWYDQNQSQYMSEEQVIVQYIELNAADLSDGVEPSDDELMARFEEQQARFVTPESRLASHALFEVASDAPQMEDEAARQKAEELAVAALDGQDFAELAREFSQDVGSAEQGGDLGWIEPGFMVQAFEDALYELTLESPISQPIRTGFGWHVINLRDIRPAEGMTFAEAREILLEEYRTEADERRFIEQADRLVDIIYEDPTTLDAAADELNLEVKETEAFGRLGGEGIASNPEVVKAAFSDLVLAQGAVSDPIDLGENHMVLILLKDYRPQALRPLEEVSDQVVAGIRQERADMAASEKADELLAAFQAGASLSELAEQQELELVSAEAAERRASEFRADLRDAVFALPRPAEGETVNQRVALNNGYGVVNLTEVKDGELSEEDQIRRVAYGRRLSNGTGNEETQGFLKILRQQSEIEVFEDRL